MAAIVTIEQMQAIEQAADANGHTYAVMMALAGRAVADRVIQLVAGIADPQITVLVGSGNNGGDGLVAGRLLKEELGDTTVTAFLLRPRPESDDVFTQANGAGVVMVEGADDKAAGYKTLQNLVASADVVIDALFGTSLRLPIRGDASKVLQTVNEALAKNRADRSRASVVPVAGSDLYEDDDPHPVVVAVDCPSGLHCDSGELDKHTIRADETITFAAAKPGLLTFPGAEKVGRLFIGDIGLPDDLPPLADITLSLVVPSDVGARLPERPLNSHKGTFGKTMVVAGSLNYIGAAYLAAHAAYRVGTGLVTVGAPQIIVPALAAMLPEATWLLLPHEMGVLNDVAVKVLRQEIDGYSAMLLGPGMGREDVTAEFLRELLKPQEEIKHARAIGFVPATPAEQEQAGTDVNLPPLVIDADGLNLLADMDGWPLMVPPGTILTPHPAEFGRLAGLETADVQANRVGLAQEKAAAWQCVIVLKGAFTVIAAPDGQAAVLPFATSALATAGSGDVLAGAIVGLLAQGLAPYDAALAGSWLHGLAGVRAGDLLETPASVTAGDVLELLPDAYVTAERARP